MGRDRADALLVFPSPMLYLEYKRIVNFVTKIRVAAVYPWREAVDAGGLISYGPSIAELYRRSATYVDKILKGTNPAELPVEQPMRFELFINLKTATQIGVTIPQSVLYRADKVIK